MVSKKILTFSSVGFRWSERDSSSILSPSSSTGCNNSLTGSLCSQRLSSQPLEPSPSSSGFPATLLPAGAYHTPPIFGRATHPMAWICHLKTSAAILGPFSSQGQLWSKNQFCGFFFPSIQVDLAPLPLEPTPLESPLAHLHQVDLGFRSIMGAQLLFFFLGLLPPRNSLFLGFPARSTCILDFCHVVVHHQGRL